MADKLTILTAPPGLYWLPELRIFAFKLPFGPRDSYFECFSAAPGGAWGKHDFDKPYEVVNPLFPDGSAMQFAAHTDELRERDVLTDEAGRTWRFFGVNEGGETVAFSGPGPMESLRHFPRARIVRTGPRALALIPEPKAEPKAEALAPAKPDAEAYTYADAEADDKRRWKLVTQLVGVGAATSNIADVASAVVETLAAERAKGRRKADGGERG